MHDQLDTQKEQHQAALNDIERRFEATDTVDSTQDDSSFRTTLAFTHPEIHSRYSYEHVIQNLLIYPAANEAARLSNQRMDKDYFGYIPDSNLEQLTAEDLERLLDGADSLWFVSVDDQSPDGQDVSPDDKKASPNVQKGFNHIIGIVPYRSPYTPQPSFIVYDTARLIDLEQPSIEALHESILNLPHGEAYWQSVFSFRNNQDGKEDPTDTFDFFTSPPSSLQ